MSPDKPSNTALIVAAGLQLVRPREDCAHLVPREAQRMGAALLDGAYPKLASLLRNRAFARACRALERATLPGILLHYALRKQRLRQHAAVAIAGGCSQVVVLGAGLDTLSMELKAAHAHLCCIEIDHPATQAGKRAGAGINGQTIHFVSADLTRQTLAAVLGACNAFDPGAATLFVAEGLLMYMPITQVAHLFSQITQMTQAAAQCQVAFTWFELQSDGKPNFNTRSRLVDLWLALRCEPFMSGQPRAQLGAFLASNGLAMQNVSDSVDLLTDEVRAALTGAEMPVRGEYICLARVINQGPDVQRQGSTDIG
jgi:methyltransferase (TIGR00027 family)